MFANGELTTDPGDQLRVTVSMPVTISNPHFHLAVKSFHLTISPVEGY